MPWMWLIAGPNGSGKSTFVDSGFLDEIAGSRLTKLNADLRARQLLDQDASLRASDADLRAVNEIDSEVDRLIESRVSFVVETVLSSDKYKPRVEKLKRYGYNLGLIYVTLTTDQDCIDRVRLRTELGGHDVPQDKIRARWERSLSNLTWFVSRADVAMIFDNTAPGSHERPVLLASKLLGGELELLKPGHHPRVDAELASVVKAQPVAAKPPDAGGN